jgi:hypothetical protein
MKYIKELKLRDIYYIVYLVYSLPLYDYNKRLY